MSHKILKMLYVSKNVPFLVKIFVIGELGDFERSLLLV